MCNSCLHQHLRMQQEAPANRINVSQRIAPLFPGWLSHPQRLSCSELATSRQPRSTGLRRPGRPTPKPLWMILTSLARMMSQLMSPSSELASFCTFLAAGPVHTHMEWFAAVLTCLVCADMPYSKMLLTVCSAKLALAQFVCIQAIRDFVLLLQV